MHQSCVLLWEKGRKHLLPLCVISVLVRSGIPSVGLGWVHYRVPCPEAASALHLQEMGGKWGSELTGLSTTYLCHHPCKCRDPISEPISKSPCVSVPAVNVILLSDNRAVSQNRGGGRGMGTLSPGCELNYF